MRSGMVGRIGPAMKQIVGFGDRSTVWGNFLGKYGAPDCNQWAVCGVVVRKCVNRQSFGLGGVWGEPMH